MTALLISLKEAIEFAIIILLLTGVFKPYKKPLIAVAFSGISAGIILAAISFPLSAFADKFFTGFLFYSFIMILFLSFVSKDHPVYAAICLILALVVPASQLTLVVMSEAALKGTVNYFYSAAGFIVGIFIFILLLRYLPRVELPRFFGYDSVMVFIAAFCFIFGGLSQFNDTSVIASLQKGIYSFLRSMITFSKDLLLIPHGNVVASSFDYILNFFATERFAMAITALILFIPPVYVFVRLLLTPEPETGNIEVKAERRKIMWVYTDELIRKGTPLLFALLVSIVMLHSANLAMNPAYDPEPVPVIADDNQIMIPLKGKYGNISDGRIRKYSIRHRGQSYRIIVMMKPDATIDAALDACEICPPYGYVQRGKHLICKYCSTPIPLDSLGQVGGCNPIPLKSTLKGNNLILDREEIVRTYSKWIKTDFHDK